LRFAHFGFAVDAGQATNTRDQSLSFHKNIAADLIVNAPHDFVGLFNERCLVLANRYEGRLERGDVGRLGNGVTQEPRRDIPAEAARANFVLDRRVALKSSDSNEVQIQHRQFGERRQRRLHGSSAIGAGDVAFMDDVPLLGNAAKPLAAVADDSRSGHDAGA
jgi:hypothetical protein